MHILTTEQVRGWDEYTIRHEPVSSIDLMERAAGACFDWLMRNGYRDRRFEITCAKGNNGGDGLVIARRLAETGHTVDLTILEFGHLGTPEFQTNLARIHDSGANIRFISSPDNIRPIEPASVVIDALLGSGLNRPVEGLTAMVVDHYNRSGNAIISIDLPSGLFADRSSAGNTVMRASHTLAFQCYKPAFLMAENEAFTGEIIILDIGLHPDYPASIDPAYSFITRESVRAILRPRGKHSQKGDYGHAALIGGSKGMIGAIVLAAKALVRSGAGKLTCYLPEAGYTVMQTSVPEAMAKVSGADHIESVSGIEGYEAIGIGPGLGLHNTNARLLGGVFESFRKPLVLDADGLNTLAAHPALFQQLPPHSILTPHPGEFKRLFGDTADSFCRIAVALQKAVEHQSVIVLKGAYTLVAMPSGRGHFNSTGNPGMATGGMGDTLTGIITGLLAQGYPPEQAAMAGVYLHGRAGDLAAAAYSEPALIASDLTEYLGQAFKELESS